MTNPVIYNPIQTGPYAGHYAVERRGERRISGAGRRPYYGHVWREGATWRATLPGGNPFPGGWHTRQQAALALLGYGKKA